MTFFSRVAENCIGNKISKIYGYCIAYHLLNVSFCSVKRKIFWKCLNHTTFTSSKWTHSFQRVYRVTRMDIVSLWYRSINTTDSRTRFFCAENTTANITAGMAIIILYVEFVAKVFCNAHFMICKIFKNGSLHKVILGTQASNHHETFTTLRNTT